MAASLAYARWRERANGMPREHNVPGRIYFLVFVDPETGEDVTYMGKSGYSGWTRGKVAARVRTHKSGRGAKIVGAAIAAGLDVRIALVIDGTRNDERKIKNRKENIHKTIARLRKQHGPNAKRRARHAQRQLT